MKRSRAPNFNNAEIMLLLKLVENYPVIENKRTDGATSKDKQMAWYKLATEYNSLTSFSPRTADNLQSCYKNQKIKVKKLHSNVKMALKAPLLLDAVEEYGQNWNLVAQATNESSLDCQNSFQQLVRDVKKEEASQKKEINRTGGGPPPPSCSDDPIIDKVKTLIGPSLEGIYTIYDGDAAFMQEQQSSVPIEAQLKPIELASSPLVENDCSTPNQNLKRLNIMKSKVNPSLESIRKEKGKVNVSHSFQELADVKMELVKSQKELAMYQIEHQKILIEIAKEKLETAKREKDFLIEKYKTWNY